MVSIFKDELKEEDEVYCALNHSITGRITKKGNYHGVYLYSIKVDDEKNFKRFIGLNSVNVTFLHWQLRKIYKEVKNGKKRESRKS